MSLARHFLQYLLVLFLIMATSFMSFAQDENKITPFQSTSLSIKDPILNLRMGGILDF